MKVAVFYTYLTAVMLTLLAKGLSTWHRRLADKACLKIDVVFCMQDQRQKREAHRDAPP
jgi:hypothetical protein